MASVMPVLSRRAVASALLAAMSMATSLAAHAQTAAPRVKFQTTQGEFVVELQAAKAPKTVENFLQYVADKHYDGTIFHRVIDGFMIQGGGFTSAMVQKPTRPPIPLEANNGLKNEVGTIAMARTGNPNSATSQFFINVANNTGLNAPQPDGYGYAVFGKVLSGMDVVDKIRQTPTGNQNGFQNVPTTPITITSVNLLK
jgi:peptidyl-prolyl cis-trans isomerase A (cyclophilin A)